MITVIFALIFLFIGTMIIEGFFALLLPDRKKWLKACFLCNLVTNPILNLLFIILFTYDPSGNTAFLLLLVAEVLVVILEAYFYQRMLNRSRGICLAFSITTNLLSFGIGVVFKAEIAAILSMLWISGGLLTNSLFY